MTQAQRPLPRLFIDAPLAQHARITLDKKAGHYLTNVLRLISQTNILVFNGVNGEWKAEIEVNKKQVFVTPVTLVQQQPKSPDLTYAFAPIKGARLDYISQKAVEMGAGIMQPLLTSRTIVRTLNTERMRKNTIEAAEQCGILALPEIKPIMTLDTWLATRNQDNSLVFCDEHSENHAPLKQLKALGPQPIDILIGPEGGFTPDERTRILAAPGTCAISLGPRILRADTAAVAAMALIEACRTPY